MFCNHCGKQLDDGSKFCMFCGNIVTAAAASAAPVAPAEPAAPVQPAAPQIPLDPQIDLYPDNAAPEFQQPQAHVPVDANVYSDPKPPVKPKKKGGKTPDEPVANE